MIKVGDMVGFKYRGEYHLAIITEDLGHDWRYGRYTGLVLGTDGDLIPLDEPMLTVLRTPSQLEQWAKVKNLRKIIDKSKQTR